MSKVTSKTMLEICQTVLGANPAAPKPPLQDYLAAITRLDSLANLPKGTCVLVRGDVDAKPGPTVGEGDIRLRSMRETLEFGRERGWNQVIFGHIGRKPEESLKKVGQRISEIMGCDVPLVEDWLDEGSATIRDSVADRIRASQPGSILLLE